MLGRAFLVTGDQEGDAALVLRMVGDEALDGDDHRRQAAFHIGGATSAEHALLIDQRGEGGVLPGLQRAGGHYVGVAGEAQHRTVLLAVGRPEVLHVFDAHVLDLEAERTQAAHHQLLTALVKRGDGRAANQVAGEFQGRGESRGGGSHCGSRAASSGKADILKQNGGHWPP
jgi:hypothetical protein